MPTATLTPKKRPGIGRTNKPTHRTPPGAGRPVARMFDRTNTMGVWFFVFCLAVSAAERETTTPVTQDRDPILGTEIRAAMIHLMK